MGLDVKNMQVCMQGVSKLLIASCCMFVKKYPVVSGIVSLLFLVYIFLPSVFSFLILFLPIVIFLAVAFRLIFRIHQQNLEDAKGQRRNYGVSSQKPIFVEDELMVGKRENSSSPQRQSIRRRNVQEKDEKDHLQEGVEEKDMVFPTISEDALVDKAALVEENLKEIREVKVDSVTTDRAESSSAGSQRARPEFSDVSEGRTKKFNGGGGDQLEAESSDDAEDEDEDEAQEDRNKAVEWTEDDQKNLMDLGLSEMERNKRLESLIAKRKARKLLSLQVRRTLMNIGSNDPRGQISSILIPRNNPFPPNSSGSAQVSPTPGSAPSVLLPMHNPFDLPYDPQEEKPNLSGGSFEEEFTPMAQQKDTVFCRHESFSLGAFFPGPGEFDQSRRETFFCPNFGTRQRASELAEFSRLRNQSGKEDPDKLIQRESSEEGEPVLDIDSSNDNAMQPGQPSEQVLNWVDIDNDEEAREVHTESNIRRDITGGSSSSSSSEVNVPFSAANKDAILKSLSFSVRKNIVVDKENSSRRDEPLYDGSPPSFEKKRPEESFFDANIRVHHTPTLSIASDLQVEVSEVGSNSPSLTVDGTISEGESPVFDGDVDVDLEKETNSGSEDTWVASSQLSRVEENESRSREVHEVSERDIIEVGFSRINHKPEDPVASDLLPEKVVEQDSTDTGVSSANIEEAEGSQNRSTDLKGEILEEVPPISTSEALSTESANQSTEQSEAHSSHNSNSGKPEERSDSPVKTAQETVIDDMNDQVVFANDDTEILEFIKTTYGEAPGLIKREAPEDPSGTTVMANTIPVEITEGSSDFPVDSPSDSTEYLERKFKNRSEQESFLIGIQNIKGRNGEQGFLEVGSSGPEPNSYDHIASVTQPEIIIEQDPIATSSSSSPTSVTEEKVPISQVSLLNVDQTTKVQQLGAEAVDYDFLDKLFPESSNLTVPQDALLLAEDSVAYPSDDRGSENPQDSEVPASDDVTNLNIANDLTSEGHKLTEEENVLSKLSKESLSKTIEVACLEGQSGKVGGHQTILESYNPNMQNDVVAETSNPAESNGILESTQESERDTLEVNVSEVSPSAEGHFAPVMLTGTGESGHSGLNQSFNDDHSPPALLPEVVVVEQVPTASSSSSSPNSVLQSKFSVASMLSLDPEHIEAQPFERETEENNTINGIPAEHVGATVPENASHSMEDSTSGNVQETPSSPGKSTNEDNANYMNDSASTEKEEKLCSESVIEGQGQPAELIKQEALINPKELSDATRIEGPGGGIEQLTASEAVPIMPEPKKQNDNPTKGIEKFGQSMELEDDGDPSMPTHKQDILEATEVVEDKSPNLTLHEAYVGLSEPAEQHDDSSTPVTYSEREEPSKTDPASSTDKTGFVSNGNEVVVNVTAVEDNLSSGVGGSEGETRRLMRPVDVSEQSENGVIANSKTIDNDEAKSKELTEAGHMVGASQPAPANFNLNNTNDTVETRESIDQGKATDLPQTDGGSEDRLGQR